MNPKHTKKRQDFNIFLMEGNFNNQPPL